MVQVYSKKRNLQLFLFGVMLLLASGYQAAADIPTDSGLPPIETPSFIIAPAPVGYPSFTSGSDAALDGRFVYTTGAAAGFMDEDMAKEMDNEFNTMGGVVFFNYRITFSRGFLFNAAAGGGMLRGNEYDFRSFLLPIQANAAAAVINTPALQLFVFAGAGGNAAFSRMELKYPDDFDDPGNGGFNGLNGGLETSDTLTAETTTMNWTYNGGVQLNYTFGSFVISTYYTYTGVGGRFETEISSGNNFSYENAAQSGDMPDYSSSIFGLDVLYKPLNVSLSSSAQLNEYYKLFTLALRKQLWSR